MYIYSNLLYHTHSAQCTNVLSMCGLLPQSVRTHTVHTLQTTLVHIKVLICYWDCASLMRGRSILWAWSLIRGLVILCLFLCGVPNTRTVIIIFSFYVSQSYWNSIQHVCTHCKATCTQMLSRLHNRWCSVNRLCQWGNCLEFHNLFDREQHNRGRISEQSRLHSIAPRPPKIEPNRLCLY